MDKKQHAWIMTGILAPNTLALAYILVTQFGWSLRVLQLTAIFWGLVGIYWLGKVLVATVSESGEGILENIISPPRDHF